MTKDMTVGSPMQLILKFSIPLLFGNILQQMYNLIDSIIVGQYLGLSALSSVGATGSITFLIIGFCTGTCCGFAIPVAQQFGAGKYSNMRKYVMNAAYLSVVFSIIMTIATVILCRPILTLMKTPEQFYEGAYIYLIVIFIGIPFTFLYNIVSGIIRAMGDSKTPFYFLVVATVINIVLDLLFIIVFKWGIAGAGLATIIAQGVAGALCLVYMKKRYDILRTQHDERRFDKGFCKTLIVMGVPMGLQYSITAIGSIMMQASVNLLGDIYVSVVSVGGKIKQFAMCPYDAFATASSTYCGQNLGAGKVERIGKGVFSAVFVSVVYSVVVAVVLIIWGADISLIFVDKDQTDVIALTAKFLACAGPFYVFLAILNNVRMSIQGLGYSGLSMIAGVSELFARGVMSLWVIPELGFIAACYADQAAWLIAATCVVVMYFIIMKKINQNIKLKKD